MAGFFGGSCTNYYYDNKGSPTLSIYKPNPLLAIYRPELTLQIGGVAYSAAPITASFSSLSYLL
jgi:hypothetical protein